MRCANLRAIAIALLALAMMMSALPSPSLTIGVAAGVGESAIAPGGDPLWEDDYDDMSKVYMPPGGLADVEVTGGHVQLLANADEGWIASTVITCPSGYRYDLVTLEVDTPGLSKVQVSILDATRESDVVGYANATVVGYEKLGSAAISIYSINPALYPELRIQINLIADGSDRPLLRGYKLYYVGFEEWRDDFLGTNKMIDSKGINITDGKVEINLTKRSAGGGPVEYEEFPPIAVAGGANAVTMFYPNDAGTGYKNGASLGISGSAWYIQFEDVDGDGFLDLIVPKMGGDSHVFWGDSSGTWSTVRKVDITAGYGRNVAIGDVNGDGEMDLVFAVTSSSGDSNSAVFLNQGNRQFNTVADILYSQQDYTEVATGDLNNDGYDDILFAKTSGAKVFYGGADGPGTDPDISIATYLCQHVFIRDVDKDGYLDIITADDDDNRFHIFLGGENGPDTTADYALEASELSASGFGIGDINGDGHDDFVYYGWGSGGYGASIFEGSASGWSDSNVHGGIEGGYTTGLDVADVNKDGYDDVIIAYWESPSYKMEVFYGGTSFPTTADISVTGSSYLHAEAAVPSKSIGGPRIFRGSFDTQQITLPEGKKWDMVKLDGILTQNTSMTISILDTAGKPIAGFEDLDNWNVDLSDLSNHRTIGIRVSITSEFNWTTPILDRLTIKWMDEKLWRDEFYGDAKIARLLGMGIVGNELVPTSPAGAAPNLIFSSLRNDDGYNSHGKAYIDSGNLDYISRLPIDYNARGAAAVAVSDVNGDGYLDIAFATFQTSDTNHYAKSPLFLGSPVGWTDRPSHEFATVGASDILMEDLNGDGYTDIVIAQQTDGNSYIVSSDLYWGTGHGWGGSADVSFSTTGASGVVAEDLDGDGDLDLVFSNYKSTSTSTDSMVFLQEHAGFCGTAPSYSLPTKGALSVAVGDIDGDGNVDLVFANSFSGGFAEISSYVYWGKAGGGFVATPGELPTKGGADVEVADLNGDGKMDIVFANRMDNTEDRAVDSFVYLGDGSRTLPTTPAASLSTLGATAVTVADLDGSGWKDLVFACTDDGQSYGVDSRVFLGDSSGWSTSPDIMLPTEGASDVVVERLVQEGTAGYLSQAITIDPSQFGSFETLSYSGDVDASLGVKAMIVDAETLEVLAQADMTTGQHQWDVVGSFSVKEHASVRVVVAVEGLASNYGFNLHEISLNWSERVLRRPWVNSFEMSDQDVLRTQSVVLNITAMDEFDPAKDLRITVNHRLNGTEDWEYFLVSKVKYVDGVWRVDIRPKVDALLGDYDFQVRVSDSDDLVSADHIVFGALRVINNRPTQPEIQLTPARPVSTSTLRVEIQRPASDIESTALSYRFRWYRDGVLMANITSDSVPSYRLGRGQNWSVEVAAFDGDDEGPAATGWKVIQNAAPLPSNPLPDPDLPEDTTDTNWLDLSTAFEDPDGDTLTWTVQTAPVHMTVTIDPATGKVTIVPDEDWNGEEEITFVASDGELQATQTVIVLVTPINDAPSFLFINGEPVGTDPVEFTITQGEQLLITPFVVDVEGHELVFSVNTSAVDLDDVLGHVRFEPDNDAIGTLRFGLRVYDIVSPETKVSVNIVIHVVNKNDAMDEPRITNPDDGDEFKANMTYYFSASCYDPDTQYGQELNYTWSSDIEGILGYGNNLDTALTEVGDQIITLTVTDGEFQRSVYVSVVVKPNDIIDPDPDPDPNTGPDPEGPAISGLMLGVMALLIGAGAAGFVVAVKRREDTKDAKLDEELGPEEMDETEALKRMAAAAKASADALEESKNGNGNGNGETEPWVETEVKEGIKVETTSPTGTSLTIEAKVTKEASEDIAALWNDIDQDGNDNGNGATEEDRDALRLENLKRQYQNAIGRLPYGIPSEALKDWEWVDLAASLATGEKKMVDGSKEVTRIDGHWYYSDNEDTGTFLKEHGARPKTVPKKAAVTMDRQALMAKLEERFILGEISEETFIQLKEKYDED